MRHVSSILLTLPDSRLVFQRRMSHAPVSPNMLGFFGGHVEEGESYDGAMIRELGEETSLKISQLTWGFIQDFVFHNVDLDEDITFHLYWAEIPDADFKVYEGQHAEVYTRNEALKRKDLAGSTRYVLENILKEKK